MRKTYFDILVEKQFQDNVKRKLSQGSLSFRRQIRKPIPLLYKYRALSEYSLNDIRGKTISFSRIDNFNDVYDSSLHNSYSKRNEAGLWQIEKDFFLSAFVGTYASCFSELNDSILMWSHYGDCSRGICIEYDFRLLSPNNLLTKVLFPIAYTKRPLDFSDWLDDGRNAKEVYPIDSAVLCASLNKSKIWEYEKEWRFVMIDVDKPYHEVYCKWPIDIYPKSITLGYHFLKKFFCNGDVANREQELQVFNKNMKCFLDLLSFVKQERIEIKYACPLIGEYHMSTIRIDVLVLEQYIFSHFKRNNNYQPQNMIHYAKYHNDFLISIGRYNNE